MSTNFNANTYLIIFFSFLALLLKGCSGQDAPDSDLGRQKTAFEVYYYAGKEQASRPFDEKTGALKSGISLLDLSKEPFALGTLKGISSKIQALASFQTIPIIL